VPHPDNGQTVGPMVLSLPWHHALIAGAYEACRVARCHDFLGVRPDGGDSFLWKEKRRDEKKAQIMVRKACLAV